MLQNKIYLNFITEISKTFLVVLFGLSLIALTVRAVSFLELIVENGYPVGTYFKIFSFKPFWYSSKIYSFIISNITNNIYFKTLTGWRVYHFMDVWCKKNPTSKFAFLFFYSYFINLFIIFIILNTTCFE